MKKSDMLECLINYYTDGNKAKFSAMLGVKPQTVSAWIARNSFDAEILYTKCKELSADWLLSNGSGDMIKTENHTATANGDSSIAAINSNVTLESNVVLKERLKSMEELLKEKERLISVLLSDRDK